MSLETETEKKENEKLICLGRAAIKDHYTYVEIPEQATLLRTKKGHVNFFKGMQPEGSKNGWSEIPKQAEKVYFPGYRPITGNYGKPAYR